MNRYGIFLKFIYFNVGLNKRSSIRAAVLMPSVVLYN